MQIPTALNFRIRFTGLDDPNEEDAHFHSVSGLQVLVNNQPHDRNIVTGQNNGNMLHTPLVLKRAVKNYSSSALSRWLFAYFNKKEGRTLPQALIELLSEEQQPIMSWIIKYIRPVSWKLDELNAEKNEVLMETIELEYKELLLTEPGKKVI